ncbi:MAG: hypothetical protein E7579_11160 [Ruminococcaceae bacterium]|nr:hypothetical protein [Oscillospiraceae bacterium]
MKEREREFVNERREREARAKILATSGAMLHGGDSGEVDKMAMAYIPYEVLTMERILRSDCPYYLLVPWRFIRRSLTRMYFVFAILLTVMAIHYVGGAYLLPAYGIMYYKYHLFTLRMRNLNLSPTKFRGLLAGFMAGWFLLARAVLCLLGWNLY